MSCHGVARCCARTKFTGRSLTCVKQRMIQNLPSASRPRLATVCRTRAGFCESTWASGVESSFSAAASVLGEKVARGEPKPGKWFCTQLWLHVLWSHRCDAFRPDSLAARVEAKRPRGRVFTCSRSGLRCKPAIRRGRLHLRQARTRLPSIPSTTKQTPSLVSQIRTSPKLSPVEEQLATKTHALLSMKRRAHGRLSVATPCVRPAVRV
jgi:hypothetical protein